MPLLQDTSLGKTSTRGGNENGALQVSAYTKRIILSQSLTLASILVLPVSCLAQDPVGSITGVLSQANISASVGYWSPERCGSPNARYPRLPEVRAANDAGSPREALQELFVNDARMRVTPEASGIVRMFESDVPTDLLEVKISHISFDAQVHGADMFRGPNMAMRVILSTPEVQAFGKAHNVGPFFASRLPSNAMSGRRAYGELNNVTVAQALDYLLQIFPGFWIYGNCRNEAGDREVFFWFLENVPRN
jgi:hypothetical protein